MHFALSQSKVATPSKIVPAVTVKHTVRKLERLIPAKCRSGVIESREISERQIRQTPIEWVLRDTRDAEQSLYVLLKPIQVHCRRPIPVVLNIERIVGASQWTDITEGRLYSRPVVITTDSGKGVAHDAARGD